MRLIKSPEPFDLLPHQPKVFLAGSIEMGQAEDWQTQIAKALQDLPVTLLNPRRDAWEPDWPQTMDFGPFREQVEWELAAQAAADLMVFYFSPATKSPITLLELGLAAGRKPTVVCCPTGFWRKGNIDIVCTHYQMPQRDTLTELISYLREAFTPA